VTLAAERASSEATAGEATAGPRLTARGSGWQGALAGALAAAFGIAGAWGFSVDDALISARVAAHLWQGLGYRFNVPGPIVDCVTPLGWAFLLAPVAGAGAWQGMTWASLAGGALWVGAGAALGRSCSDRCSGVRRWGMAIALASCLPLAAWAVSGMETPLVMALGVAALASSRRGAACAGIAAALRPELLPWAVTLSLGSSLARRDSPAGKATALVLAVLPAIAVACARKLSFGSATPLAVFAKPSDFEHGLRYALGSLLLSGLPYLLLAPRAWRQLGPAEWALGAALSVHWFVLLGIGGDWMPFWRLAMPVFPGVLVLGAALAERSSGLANALRLALVVACGALLQLAKGPETRAVRGERARLMAMVSPLLQGAERVASVDVGWVGAAGPYQIVDLAGVTDPEVAYLSGGHTSKRLPVDFLERRDVDALVLLLAPDSGAPGTSPRFARPVESRVLGLRGADRFEPVGRVPLNPHQDYLVLRRSALPGTLATPVP
jgi:hypothetical protein